MQMALIVCGSNLVITKHHAIMAIIAMLQACNN